MKHNPLLSPQALSRLLQDAAAAWTRQDYPKTIELLERARRGDPANINLLLDLARAYGLRYDYAAAGACFERAARLLPRPFEVLAEAGRRCLEFGNEEMASGYFERACREPAAPLAAMLTIAELNERHHRLDAAAEMLAHAGTAFKDDPRVLVACARLKKAQGAIGEAEPLLRSALACPAAEAQLKIQAWYDLAAMLDRAGRFDEAHASLLEGKAIQQRHAAPFNAQLKLSQARVSEMGESMTAEVLARWRGAGAEFGPARKVALLCGHPRSGTTLLEQMLDAHPEIIAAEETQVLHDEAYLPLSRGFAQNATMLQVLDAASSELLRHSRADYFHCTELFLRQPIGDKLLVDKNPSLTVLLPSVARIFPEMLFLVALRDPRDVCISCFMQPLGLNSVSSAYLSLGGTVNQYASVMGLWLKLRRRVVGQWREVRYEQLIADPAAICREALEFLGVGWDESVLKFDAHARTKRVKSPSYADVVKPVYNTAIGRWRHYERHLAPHLDKLTPFLKAFGYD